MAEQTLAGNVAVVTGARSGIGRTTALLLAEDGATIAVNRTPDDSQDTTDKVPRNGSKRLTAIAVISIQATAPPSKSPNWYSSSPPMPPATSAAPKSGLTAQSRY